MASFYQLDYGCQVRILEGEYKNKVGIIVMGSRFGDVGVNLDEVPKIGMYHTRIDPSILEIISLDDKHGIKKMTSKSLSEFEAQKLIISLQKPKIVLDNPQYFSKMMIERVRRTLNSIQ